ncbi:hypothetical protein F4779DRAFT_623888 [Xylariaceae sp. FL0662B]|nr:hypothetical protein F4779DRAFT_623888 [Xylariaceae sp. FL0662B]
MVSGYNPVTRKYAASHDDVYLAAFCIVLLTGIRAGLMQYILASLARHCGVSKPKDVTGFSEQGWDIDSGHAHLFPIAIFPQHGGAVD